MSEIRELLRYAAHRSATDTDLRLLEKRSRRLSWGRRLRIGSAAVLAAAVIAALGVPRGPRESVVLADRPAAGSEAQGGGTTETPAGEPTPFSGKANVLVPETRRRDRLEEVELTFLDGRVALVAYPEELALASLGVTPSGTLALRRDTGETIDVPLWLPRGSPPDDSTEVVGGTLVSTAVYPPSGARFAFVSRGRWSVGVPLDQTGDLTRGGTTLGAALGLSVTPAGYPLLRPAPGVLLASGFRQGPGLTMGTPDGNMLELFLWPCQAAQETVTRLDDDQYFGNACRGGVTVHASGGEAFVSTALAEVSLELENPAIG